MDRQRRKIELEDEVGTIVARINALTRDRTGPVLVAIDGRSGVGKSTLAQQVGERFGATVVESDDFYSGGTDAEWTQRTPAERVAGCIDWRRLRSEALTPLLAGRTAVWHPFNFLTDEGLAEQMEVREPTAVIILDGIYSARPELRDLVDLAVLVEIPDDRDRRQRLISREGARFMTAWHAIWDDAEEHYFGRVCPRESFDLIVTPD